MGEQYNCGYVLVNNPGSFTFNNLGCINAKMKYGERLRVARQHAKLSQAQLGELAGTSQANVSKLEKSDATGSEFTVQFALACQVNPLWLAKDEGPMAEAPVIFRENSVEYKIQLIMAQMDEHTKQQLLRISNALVEPEANGNTK